jgi:hypothetical protein
MLFSFVKDCSCQARPPRGQLCGPRSVRERRGRLVDEHRVGPPHDLDRVGRGGRLVRGGERQALVGAKHGHDPHGHSVLALFREGGDDAKAVALDSVVGDTGHIAEVDDLSLEGLQATAFSSRRRAWRLCAQQSVATLSGHHPFVR